MIYAFVVLELPLNNAAVNAVKSAIVAKPSATVVAEMNSAGLDKVTSATVTVSAPVAAPSVSATSATHVKFNFYNHAGTCAGSETSLPVTNTIGKNCDGPDAGGAYNTVTVSGDKLKTMSYSDSSCMNLMLTLSNCECGKCCEVYDAMLTPIADVMLTCSIKEPSTPQPSTPQQSTPQPSAPQPSTPQQSTPPDINEQPKGVITLRAGDVYTSTG